MKHQVAITCHHKLTEPQHSILLARTFASTARRNEINKVLPSAAEALTDMKGDTTLLCGGFGLCGVPDTLINEVLKKKDIKGLTAVSNNAGTDNSGLGQLLKSKQIKKMIASYIGENKTFEKMYLTGEIQLELTPQGTLAERCSAGGRGIPAFYTPAAFGTVVQTGELPLINNADGTPKEYSYPKDVKVFDGKSYLLEESIKGDYAFVKAWKADIFVVVAFRMLPKVVWEIPRLGTFNLHAALLPQYRGAAPINWAVINGDKATGVTTFMIDDGMDTGKIMFREQCLIGPDETVGEVHDKLMEIGSDLVVQTVDAIIENNIDLRIQNSFIQGSEILRPAPKLTRELCHIDWNGKIKHVYNLIRGLSPYPAAFTELVKDDKTLQMKIYKTVKVQGEEYATMLSGCGMTSTAPGTVLSDGKTYLAFATADGAISVTELQLAGKKRMAVKDFLIGFREPQTYTTSQGTSSQITGKHA